MTNDELQLVPIFIEQSTYEMMLPLARKNQRSVAEEISQAILNHVLTEAEKHKAKASLTGSPTPT